MSYPIVFTDSGSNHVAIASVNGATLTAFPRTYYSDTILYVTGTLPAKIFQADPGGKLNILQTMATGTTAQVLAASSNASYLISIAAANIVSIGNDTTGFTGTYLFSKDTIMQAVSNTASSGTTLYINANGSTLRVETSLTNAQVYSLLSAVNNTQYLRVGSTVSHAVVSVNGAKVANTMQFILNNRSVIFNGAVPGDTANTWTQYTGYQGEPFKLISVS